MWGWLTRYSPKLYRSGEMLFATSWPASLWWLLLALSLVFVAATIYTGNRTQSLTWHRKLTLISLQFSSFAVLLLLLARDRSFLATSVRTGCGGIGSISTFLLISSIRVRFNVVSVFVLVQEPSFTFRIS